MSSDLRNIMILLMLAVVSCTPYRKMQKIVSGEVGMVISVPDEKPLDEEKEDVKIDSIRGSLTDEPIIMNAIRDNETGEMVATDVIDASRVVARFRNVAERAGYVSISFDVIVPEEMSDSDWQLKLRPLMRIQEDTLRLDPIYITGAGYRAGQLRGYQRYRNFLASIISDTTDFIRIGQLEIFLERFFPETYAMRTGSSFVSDSDAETLFGATQADALRHYTRRLKWIRNERRKARADRMYGRYVKDPIVVEGIRLDTVITSSDGDFVYRYMHTFRSRPNLKKVMVTLSGDMYERGECIHHLPFPEELTYYISSLSTMADLTPKYRMIILQRTVYDNTKALIDFALGSSEVDTTLSDNASELRRIRRCIEDVVARDEYALDSLVIMASCSPEGSYAHNRRLSAARSEAIRKYIGDYVPEEWRDSCLKTSLMPENWEQLRRLVANDTLMGDAAVKRILAVTDGMKDPDVAERKLSRMAEYRYLRERIYPKLRSVSFDFHLHRVGMQKDTVHTTELDTVYMAGLDALKELDYKKAVALLRPYGDYNSALAFMSADYNHSALDVLNRLDDRDPKVCYLKAMVLSRLEMPDEAMKYFELSIAYDPYMEYRANLDPEMFSLVKKRQTLINYNAYE
jgi:tetratricopeptide (TPR) repeat protein